MQRDARTMTELLPAHDPSLPGLDPGTGFGQDQRRNNVPADFITAFSRRSRFVHSFAAVFDS